MSVSSGSDPGKESVVVYDISPQLEAELLRRARAKGVDPAEEAAEILEQHVESESSDDRE